MKRLINVLLAITCLLAMFGCAATPKRAGFSGAFDVISLESNRDRVLGTLHVSVSGRTFKCEFSPSTTVSWCMGERELYSSAFNLRSGNVDHTATGLVIEKPGVDSRVRLEISTGKEQIGKWELLNYVGPLQGLLKPRNG